MQITLCFLFSELKLRINKLNEHIMEDKRENQRGGDRDKEQVKDQGYTPGNNDKKESREGNSDSSQNLKWDQAQRRQQAGPRSYNESTDSENVANQNTEAASEQIDDNPENPNDPKKIGDQISERQQTMDEKYPPRDQDGNRRKNNQ